jgi:hypothetical protein
LSKYDKKFHISSSIKKFFSYALSLFLIIILVFLFKNSFPENSYESVASKWSRYGKVIPPMDYNPNKIRPVDFDFLSPKESAEKIDFYWLEITGDLLTLTNRNFAPVKGKIIFDLEADPCGNSREVIFGSQQGPKKFTTSKNEVTPVEIEFSIKSNSAVFLAINTSNSKICKINEGLNRSFLAKISNVSIVETEFVD